MRGRKYRNRGIGKLLLIEAEAEARRRNIFKLELTAWNFNQSVLEFYRNYGLRCQKVILEKEI